MDILKNLRNKSVFIYLFKMIIVFGFWSHLPLRLEAQEVVIFIRTLGGGEIHELNFPVNEKITLLLEKVQALNLDPNTLHLLSHPNSYFNKNITLADYNVQNNEYFIAAKMDKKAPDIVRKNAFLEAAWNGEKAQVKNILKSIRKVDRAKFVMSCKAESDHYKIAPYYAARKGFLDILKVIKRKFTDEQFKVILATKDDEGRTILMASVRAVNNMKKTIDFVAKYSSAETLSAIDDNGYTAYDWARRTNVEDKKILAKLLKISGASIYKD